MARTMLSSRSMRLISTVETLMPQPSVCLSRTSWMSALSLSRSASISSRSCLPSTQRSVVCASWLVAAMIVRDLDDRALGIDDAEIEDGVHLDRDVVARNHVLRRHVIDDHAQVDAHHLLDERHDQERGPGPWSR